MNRQTKPIRFKYEKARATQVILWFLLRHGITDKLKLVKMVFFADREHLARYGRPIVGGAYYAMPHGPASSELLDYIENINNEKEPPFIVDKHKLYPHQQFNEDYLSESDIEVLEEIDKKYGKCDSWALRNLTHELKAYKKNYPEGESTSVPLPYEDFFLDLADNGMLEIIREDQETLADLS
jgi:uncharacterized phage-associated protein